jgi:hypothetical protein
MDNRLIFLYYPRRVQTEPRLLRKALRGLPTQRVLGEQWSDTEGQVDPGDG